MLREETLQFYRELRENNNKEWFDNNRGRYQKSKEDYLLFVIELLAQMRLVDPGLAHLNAKDCIFRINRDIRFSNDKRPYKTHLGIIMTPGGRKLENAGYYVHLDEAEESFVGGGIWMPSSEVLKKIRNEISVFHDDLQKIVSSGTFTKVYGSLDRTPDITLIRPPKGYDESHPAIEFLKLKSVTASQTMPSSIVKDPKAIEKIVASLSAIKPLLEFLNRALRD